MVFKCKADWNVWNVPPPQSSTSIALNRNTHTHTHTHARLTLSPVAGMLRVGAARLTRALTGGARTSSQVGVWWIWQVEPKKSVNFFVYFICIALLLWLQMCKTQQVTALPSAENFIQERKNRIYPQNKLFISPAWNNSFSWDFLLHKQNNIYSKYGVPKTQPSIDKTIKWYTGLYHTLARSPGVLMGLVWLARENVRQSSWSCTAVISLLGFTHTHTSVSAHYRHVQHEYNGDPAFHVRLYASPTRAHFIWNMRSVLF